MNLEPSSWLTANASLIPQTARVLDVACGAGRHALVLAAAGCEVTAIDGDAEKVAALRASAARLGLSINAHVQNLETAVVDFGVEAYDAIVVFNYLHRPLFPAIVAAVRPGGILLYETFTVEQALRGHPRNPAFLLKAGELQDLVRPLHIVASREGEFDGKMIASVAARKNGKSEVRSQKSEVRSRKSEVRSGG